MPKEKPKVNIGEVIKSYRSDRGLSQGDIERRTGLLRCYLSRVENGHTVPSLETLAKIAEAMEISLADFFPGSDTPQDRETRKMLGELSEEEIRFLADIKKYSATLSEDDKKTGPSHDSQNGHNHSAGTREQAQWRHRASPGILASKCSTLCHMTSTALSCATQRFSTPLQ